MQEEETKPEIVSEIPNPEEVVDVVVEERQPKGATTKPFLFDTAEDLENAIEQYFISCQDETGKWIRPLTVSGLANSIGTNRMTLLNYTKKDDLYPGFAEVVNRAKSRIEQYVEEYLFLGRNQAGAIFNLKNNWEGWKEKTEAEINNPDGNLKNIVFIKNTNARPTSYNQLNPQADGSVGAIRESENN